MLFGGGGPLLRARRRRAAEEPEIDLIPVMNLFVTIIPFLLLGVSFYQLGGIASTVPTQARTGASDVASSPRAVTLTIGVSHARGYTLQASGTGVAPEALAALRAEIPKRPDGSFDTAALTAALLRVKQAYAESDTIVLVPGDDVLFADLVRTMDAARDVVLGDEPTALARRLTLFPRVVLASRVES